MPIALLTGPDDPAETRRAINELIIEINASGGGGGGGSPALLVESGAESTISALAAGTAPAGSEVGVFVQGGVDVKLTAAQLLTSASAASGSGLDGTGLTIQAGDGDPMATGYADGGYGGEIYVRGGYGNYAGGKIELLGGYSPYAQGGEVFAGYGSVYRGGYGSIVGGRGPIGGNAYVVGGQGQTGVGGSVHLRPGAGFTTNGDVILYAYKTIAPSTIGALWVDPLTKIVMCVTT